MATRTKHVVQAKLSLLRNFIEENKKNMDFLLLGVDDAGEVENAFIEIYSVSGMSPEIKALEYISPSDKENTTNKSLWKWTHDSKRFPDLDYLWIKLHVKNNKPFTPKISVSKGSLIKTQPSPHDDSLLPHTEYTVMDVLPCKGKSCKSTLVALKEFPLEEGHPGCVYECSACTTNVEPDGKYYYFNFEKNFIRQWESWEK